MVFSEGGDGDGGWAISLDVPGELHWKGCASPAALTVLTDNTRREHNSLRFSLSEGRADETKPMEVKKGESRSEDGNFFFFSFFCVGSTDHLIRETPS